MLPPAHYFLDCFLYSIERQTLFSLIEQYIPKFSRLTKKRKLDIILMGYYNKNNDEDEFLHVNTIIMKAVQMYIFKTKRL